MTKIDGWRAAAFLGLSLTSMPLDASAARRPQDVFGRALVSESGERIRYPRDERFQGQPPQAPSSRTRPPARRSPAALDVQEEWRRSIMGVGIGETGLYVADVDGDGGQEVVAAAGPFGFWAGTFFYVLRHVNGEYVQDWVSDELPQAIASLRIAQLDADPALEVLVGTGGQILIFDGATHGVQQTVTTTAAEVRGLTVADVDSDGQLELVFCDDSALYVYGVASGAQEYVGPGFGGWDVGVGNVDDDATLEIVVGNGASMGYVLNGQTHAVEWANPWGFGVYARLGDIDGDGRQEVVAGYSWYTISIFDVELQSLTASIPTDLDVGAVRVLDVEGDGPLEIVYGDSQWGSIHVHNGQTLLQKWEIPNPEHGVTDVAFGDPDGDGAREVLWGGGHTSTGPDYLFVADAVTQALEWQNLDISGPFLALSHGDVDADGMPEILYGCFESESGYDDGLWFVHDAATHALEYQSGSITGLNWTGLWRIGNADVDADPQQEIFVTSSYTYDGRIYAFDGLTHAQEWMASIPSGLTFSSMAVADVDLDGALEVVAGTEVQHTGASGTYVYVFDAATGGQEWQSPILVPGFANLSLLRVANVDGDPNPEIVVANWGGQLFVIDGVTHTTNNLGDHETTALDTPDRDGNGVAEIVVGTDAGDIQVLSTTGTVLQTVASYATRIDGLQVVDVTGDGGADYVLSTDDQVLVRNGAGALEWNSGTLRFGSTPVVGVQDSLRVADADQDGNLEILVNIGNIGFRVYQIASPRDVSVTIDDSPDPVLVGSDVAFTVTASNLSSPAAAGVVLTAELDAGFAFVSSSPGPPACTAAGQTVTCGLGSLAGGASAVVTVTAQATAAGALTTQASVAAAAPDPAPLNNADAETTTATQTIEADLAMGVDDGQFVAVPGQALGYTLTVANLGPWPLTSVSVVDTIPSALLGPVFTPSVGTYDPGTGAWTGLNLGPGTSVQMALDGTVDPAASGLLTNAAVVAPPGGVVDVAPANNDAVDTDVVGTRLAEVEHGASLTRPEWVAGQAFHRLRQQPYASYEVLVEATTGDVAGGSPLLLERLARDLDTVLSASVPLGAGFSRSLRWENLSGLVVDDEVVRVLSTGCGAACGPDDVYHLRAYDTTCIIPRFNNSASQTTVVVLENTTASPVSGNLWFWSPSGALLAGHAFAGLAPRASQVTNTSTIPALVGQSGSVTVSSDAGYGGLQGKAVAVEPATGFTFDSPLTPRPR